MSKKEQVQLLYDKVQTLCSEVEALELEQGDFPCMLQYDLLITIDYNDLQKHWNEENADKFIRGVTKTLKLFGIEV